MSDTPPEPGTQHELDALTMQALAMVADAGPVLDAPDHVVQAAKGLFTWRTIDAELAALTYDSLVDFELAGVRGTATTRTLSFATDDIIVEVDISGATGALQVEGVVVGADLRSVDIQFPGGPPTTAPVHEAGRFSAAARSGTMRFTFAVGTGPVTRIVQTEWVTI